MTKYIRFLILAALILSLSGCSFNDIRPKIESGKELTFFVTSDIHYLAKDLTDDGEAFQKFVMSGSGMQINTIDEIMDAFASDIGEKKPDVLIISGDLTTNGEKESHLKLSEKLKSIEKTGTSVFVIPGNHDILNPNARQFRGSYQYRTNYIDAKGFEKIYKDFGYSEAISRDKSTLSYLVALSGDVWLMMLDTAQYNNNELLGYPQGDGVISAKTFEWIEKSADLARKNNARIITVMHHNLMDHSNIVKEGYTLNNSKEAIEKFRSSGMDLFLTGHIHLQDIKMIEENGSEIYDIAGSSLSVYPQKYGVLKYIPSNGFDYSTDRVDVEGWARKSGATDKNLIGFKAYSKDFFMNQAYSMAYYRLEQLGRYSDEELGSMAKTSAIIRARYFEGTEKVLTDEIKNSQGFKLWEAMKEGRSYENFMNMANTDNLANNRHHIP